MLVVLSGLPGTGKTTLARRLSTELGATYLLIDTIEEAIAEHHGEVGALGYLVAYRLAANNLAIGGRVVADAVNAVAIARTVWLDVAREAGSPVLCFEILCSDPAEHRRRLDDRRLAGMGGPAWADVAARPYEPWAHPVHRIETAGRSIEACLADMRALSRPSPMPPAGEAEAP